MNSARKVNELEEVEDDNLKIFQLKLIGAVSSTFSSWKEELVIGGKRILFKLDTGAEVNVLLRSTSLLLKAYGR